MRRVLLLLITLAAGCAAPPPSKDYEVTPPGPPPAGPAEEAPAATDEPAADDNVEATTVPPDDPPAAAEVLLRVMTFNISHGEPAKFDLAKIASEIKTNKPDVVGLQDVDEGTKRSGGKKQAEELSTLTEMPHRYFGAAMDFDGGKYGLAILSKYPLARTRVVRLDGRTQQEGDGPEPRIAVAADVIKNDAVVPFVTLQASPDAAERADNARALVAELGGDAPRAIVSGYFTEPPNGDIGKALTGLGMIDAFQERHPTSPGFTTPAAKPARRVHFIFRGKNLGETKHGWVPAGVVSNHRAVAAAIRMR